MDFIFSAYGIFILALLCIILSAAAMVIFIKRRKSAAIKAPDKTIIAFDATDDPQLIRSVLEVALENRCKFKVRLNNRGQSFSSSLVKLEESSMLIDVLFPYEGNDLIMYSNFISIEFIVKLIAHVPYTFDTLCMNNEIYNKYPAIRVMLPKSIMRDQKRNYHRVEPSINDPVYIKFMLDGNLVTEKVANISGGGIGFYTNLGTTILWHKREIRNVTITTPEPVVLNSITIVYMTNQAKYPVLIGGKPYYYYCGAEFLNIDNRLREQIIHYVIDKEREELKRVNRLL
ncbi:MAG: PilZ domain-containing protein [Pseudomonadota bacterium]